MNASPLRRALAALALLAMTFLPIWPTTAGPTAAAQDAALSPEQQLAELFAPTVMIKKQPRSCSDDGEQFRPVEVDVLFGTDDVRLMKRGNGKSVEVKRNIQASDLYGLDESYYLDLPGNPRNPECVYEEWSKKRISELGLQPSIYARVATEPGQDGIVLQYWYYWVFNLFNNTHESDWEGIQLNFDANSVEEILEQNLLPTSVAFAQHEGGEQADWDDDKVTIDGTHIVAHPSSGSHADYYQSAVWLGWGENGSGFGCDYSDEPNLELPVQIIMMPDNITGANDDFAWLAYTGLWGEYQTPSMFSGPTGPNTKPRWDQPITWSQGTRQNSLPVPITATIGPSISQVFCGAAELGSRIVQLFPVDPKVMMGFVIGLFGGLLLFMVLAWRYFIGAFRLYIAHAYFFVTTGVIAVPIAWAGQKLEDWMDAQLPQAVNSRVTTGGTRSLYQYVLHAGMGGIQEVLLACLIGPVVIYATWRLVQGESLTFRRMWTDALELFPRVYGATLLVALLVTAMTFTVVLVPLAIYMGVKWFFSPQAVVIDRSSIRDAFRVSSNRMTGHWLRAAGVVIAVGVISGLPGPVLGTAGLIFDYFTLGQAQLVSASIYCVLYPIAVIMGTLLYLEARGTPASVMSPEPSDEAALPVETSPLPG